MATKGKRKKQRGGTVLGPSTEEQKRQSNLRYQKSARAGRTKAKQAARADLIDYMRQQAAREIQGLECGKANADVIKNKIGIIQKKIKKTGQNPTDENIFDAACELCCKKDNTCKEECKGKLREKFPKKLTSQRRANPKKSEKVYESVFSDEDDLQLKF